MKKRERVIVFDGEDKFIVKKNHTYNSATGDMRYVGPKADRIAAPKDGTVDLAPPSVPILVDNPPQNPPTLPLDTITPEPFQAPNWASLDCEQIDAELSNIRQFLSTVRMPAEALAPYQSAIQDGERQKASKCGINPPALPDVPPTPTPTPTPRPLPAVPLVNLGQPPRGGAAGGAGGGEKKPEEKKKSSLLLWILIAIGAAYLLGDKKN